MPHHGILRRESQLRLFEWTISLLKRRPVGTDDRGCRPACIVPAADPADDPGLAKLLADFRKQHPWTNELTALILGMILAWFPLFAVGMLAEWLTHRLISFGMSMDLADAWVNTPIQVLLELTLAGIVDAMICHRIRLERARLVSAKRCGFCRYPLSKKREADLCRLCPECGAAWRTNPKLK